MIFYKFTSGLDLSYYKLMKNTGSANKLYGKGIFAFSNKSILVVAGGQWNTASDK